MGGGQSRETAPHGVPDDAHEQHQRCCLWAPPVPRLKSDPIGTPMPPTPPYVKRKQGDNSAPAPWNPQRDAPLMSSRYGGLEKEDAARFQNNASGHDSTRSSSNGKAHTNGHSANGDAAAEVHEGPDAEQELHIKYELLETLGVGSTSTCHRCVHRRTGQSFACKIIDKRTIDERFQGMMQQFHMEIQALRSLQHPNIIRLFDVYISDDKIFIIMELMEGGELFDYVVERGTLTEGEASKIVRSVTSALVYMHSKNIIHRDLKPENLLLRHKPSKSGKMEVKIIDFGLSKEMVEEPVARSFLGTRGYLAPEMLQRRDYSREVDTWALGVIVFVLLCGCLPFDDDSQTVPSDAIVRQRFVLHFPRWASNLSQSAKNLLSHLLDVDPRTRYTAEQALHHPWVTGETAPRNNLLESPRMIRKSPRTKNPQSGTGALSPVAGTASRSTVARHMVRKTSI